MMLESIRIKNFQAHKDLTIEFGPRVTSIVGPSDVGKSSVIRALRWACMNVPVSSLIRDGAKTATVELVVDGHKIVRERGSENTYRLDDQEFKAFRTDVPDPIKDLMNLTESNFQSQHDPIYWFSLSAGEVSRQLNAVVNLDVIDKTLANATRRFNAAKASSQAAEEQLTRAKDGCDKLRWASDVDDEFKLVEKSEQLIAVVTDDRRKVDEVAGSVEIFGEAFRRLALQVVGLEGIVLTARDLGRLQVDVDARSKAVAAVENYAKAYTDLTYQVDALETVVATARDLGKLQTSADGLQKLVTKIEQLAVAKEFDAPDLSVIEGLAEQIKSITQKRVQLDDVVGSVELRELARKKFQSLLLVESSEFDDKVEGTCPVCGGKI